MEIIAKTHYPAYQQRVESNLATNYKAFYFGETTADLIYQTHASAVFSSNIEGNSIDLNTFMNIKLAKEKFRPHKEVEEIENLILAYELAQNQTLIEKNLLEAHQILSKTLLVKSQRGQYRKNRAGVFDRSGLVYLAVEPEFVGKHIAALFSEIEYLIETKLSLAETFYFASMLHLRFVHIHPFMDGNGRAARLLEKWFLAHHLGLDGWKIPTEQYYKEHQAEYYRNINLGINFYELDYDQCLPFLLMLPQVLQSE